MIIKNQRKSFFQTCTEYEFGWNDPPTYSYSTSQAVAGNQTFLNKRPHQLPPTALDPNVTPTPAPGPTPVLDGPPLGKTQAGHERQTEKSSTTGQAAKDKKDFSRYNQADFGDVIQNFKKLTDDLQEKLQVRGIKFGFFFFFQS